MTVETISMTSKIRDVFLRIPVVQAREELLALYPQSSIYGPTLDQDQGGRLSEYEFFYLVSELLC